MYVNAVVEHFMLCSLLVIEQLECSTGDVDVKGIDGSFHAFSRTGSMTLQINSVRGSSAASACHDLAVSIDPEVILA